MRAQCLVSLSLMPAVYSLQGVGKSEKTVDEEFDLFEGKFRVMMTDMNECKSA